MVAMIASSPLTSMAQYVDHDKIKCEPVPKAEMREHMELQKELVGKGWRVRKVKNFNGCYEVYGVMPETGRVEAYFDPATFEKLFVEQRGKVLFKKG